MNKRIISLLLVIVMALSLVACGASAPAASEAAADVAMQYITADEAKDLVNSDEYVFFDVRKAADSSANSIPGAAAWDMDKAKEGDAEAGKATMTEATKGLDKKLILVCYSGKRYAQATTNALSAIGYDMSKVYTLEGGFNNWSEKFPELTTAGGAVEAPEAVAPIEIDTSIAFAGSSTLAPVIASIGESFRTEYGTWDKVNPAFPAEEIDIPVASGGSGDGPKSVIDGTADFGMLARAVKDSERNPWAQATPSSWWLPTL